MWQKLMIYLARNEKVKNFFQSRKKPIQLANKFVVAKTENEAIKKGHSFLKEKAYASFYYLGEYESDLSVVEKTVESLLKMIKMLSKSDMDIHISVDPTQVGLQIDKSVCLSNLYILAERIKECTSERHLKNSKNLLVIDMEDASVCSDTIDFYYHLLVSDLPVGLTLQAYMYRTKDDIKKVISNGGNIRLVKGAFAENRKIAFTSPKEINNVFYDLSANMLSTEAKESGFYPIFATHDEKMIGKIIELATKNSWEKDAYEFEMLYGVNVKLQKRLVENGNKLRLYLPYGKNWWTYAIRRVGENPKNFKYIFRN